MLLKGGPCLAGSKKPATGEAQADTGSYLQGGVKGGPAHRYPLPGISAPLMPAGMGTQVNKIAVLLDQHEKRPGPQSRALCL